MEVYELAIALQNKVKLLEKGRQILKERAEAKAKAISEYDKALGLSILELKESHPATICEKIAKGQIYQKRYDMEVADAMYRNAVTKIECVKAELNGLQSVNRHLSET